MLSPDPRTEGGGDFRRGPRHLPRQPFTREGGEDRASVVGTNFTANRSNPSDSFIRFPTASVHETNERIKKRGEKRDPGWRKLPEGRNGKRRVIEGV